MKALCGALILLFAASAAAAHPDVANLRTAADKGDTGAQYSLGRAYEAGDGVARDLKQAAQWYRTAAEAGHAGAQLAYGLYGLNRVEGVPLNRIEAMAWLRKAAVQGLPQAQDHVAWGYYRGFGVAADQVEACRWESLAAKTDTRYAAARDMMLANLSEDQRAECHRRVATKP